MFNSYLIIWVVMVAVFFPSCATPQGTSSKPQNRPRNYSEYISYFEQVYKTMDENYYLPVQRENLDRFIQVFDEKIYPQLKAEKKSDDYMRWRSAAHLVDFLKSQEDVFSAFYPPKPAEKYAQEALGERIDLGIDGVKEEKDFLVKHVEPRSDAYALGLRDHDRIITIDGRDISEMTQEDIVEKLTPLKGAKVNLVYLDHELQERHEISPESKEYFKQTVFLKEIPVQGIFCLEIQKFNRMTSEDLLRFLMFIKNQNPRGLILDLRGNPGGPPLAAREISSFFLKGGEPFAYFQKKGHEKAELDVPIISDEYKYDGPIVILVDRESGSASELFAGVLQRKGRAVLMGTNTAGQVMLKSMFNLDDQSMVLLITSRGYYADGRMFSFNGLDPDNKITTENELDLVKIAAVYLHKVSMGEIKL